MDFDSVMLLWQRVTHSMRILAEQGVGYFMERLKSEDLGVVADHLEETFPEIFKYTHKA